MADNSWDGEYLRKDHQVVTEDDARGLAGALERALPDIPDGNESGGSGNLSIATEDEELGVIESFSGPTKDQLRNFIAFCRAGGFEIT